MSRTELATRFQLGDRVHIDGDTSLIARVVAFTWRSSGLQVQVSWFNQGTLHEPWIDEWRLKAAA